MALKATIFKADLNIADIDRHYYHDHALTIARHPSETDERMMVRLLAFALNAHEDLTFGRGLSTEDEPDLWQMDLTGNIELWIDLGLPDERRLRKASGRARQVIVYNYGGRGAKLWWDQNRDKLSRVNNLNIFSFSAETSLSLVKLANRNMVLQCTIQDETIWLGNEEERIEVGIETLMEKG
ncbi:MAG: hypothetical protein ACI9XC_002067 [Gammaproteobacteria bacterium]|jgi:uncharacterized protein YaeQ